MDCFVASAPRKDVLRVVISNERTLIRLPSPRAAVGRGVQELGLSSDSKFQTADVRRRSRGTMLPELCVVPPKRREQGMPDARCTRGLVCKIVRKKAHTSIQVQRRHSGIPCAMVLRLTSRSPRRIRLCCLRRLRTDGSAPGRAGLPFRRLDANHEAPGPHDFAVRFGIARPARPEDRSRHERAALRSHRAHDAAASTASRPNVRDDGQRPFLEDRMAGVLNVICPTAKAEICPTGCFVAAAIEMGNARIRIAGRRHAPIRRRCDPVLGHPPDRHGELSCTR